MLAGSSDSWVLKVVLKQTLVLMWYSTRYDALMMTSEALPVPTVLTVVQGETVFFEAKFRFRGKQVKRRIGRAWLDVDSKLPGDVAATERVARRRGRIASGYFDERTAQVRASMLVAEYVEQIDTAEQAEIERRAKGASFRDLAHAYLSWLEIVKGAAPSTLRQHRSDLAEPGVPYKRGQRTVAGHIMRAFGDKPASKVTTEDVERLLASVAATGVSPRTINRYREVVCAAFNFGMKSTQFRLATNPANDADRRRLPAASALVYYTPEEVETVARALEDGLHREVNERHARGCASRSDSRCNCKPTYRARGEQFATLVEAQIHNRDGREADEIAADRRDADAVRVAAYAGLRMGEMLALRVGDIDWAGSALVVSRAVSAGVERGTKTGRVRQVPLADQAGAALARVLQREDFHGRDDYVFSNAYGRRLDGSALRRRYKRARDAVGLRPLRWHDLRHTFGSLLVAGGIDLVSVKDAMGHTQLTTTSRYLHARPATERAAAFTGAFNSTSHAPTAATLLPG